MILYFTGTGNSRYVADMLADLCGDESVSMNDCIKSGAKAEFNSEKPYVFVCPTYVSAIPRAVEDFIRSAAFSGSEEVYFVMTCAGGMGACPAFAERLCEEKGFIYRGTAQIVMPQNYLVFFTIRQPEEAKKIVADAEPSIRELASFIRSHLSLPDPGMKKWELVSTEMILDMYYRWFMPDKKFWVTENCIGCGLCEKKCPLNNISVQDGKPVWKGSCTHCMACISCCPKEAIEYGKKSVGKPRNRCISYRKQG